MFGFGKKIPELDQLIQSVEMNMENKKAFWYMK